MSANWEYYRIFYFVAKYENVTRAADALLSSQPAVTRSIQHLEQDLGCRLFVRSKRGVTLTPEGALLYGRIAPAYESITRGEEEVSAALGPENGSVSVSTTETALQCFLLDKLSRFQDTYPGVRLKLLNLSTPQALENLKNGRSDLAVVTTPAETAPPLLTRTVRTFSDLLVGGSKYAQLTAQVHTLAELSAYPLVALADFTTTHSFYESFYASVGLPYRPDIELASSAMVLPLILRNLGIGFVPDDLARPALAKGLLYRIPLREAVPKRQIALVSDPQKPMGKAAKILLRVLSGPDMPE